MSHAIAACRRNRESVADEALSLITRSITRCCPHVIDVDEAMRPDAPLLFPDMITRGVETAAAAVQPFPSGWNSRSATSIRFAADENNIEQEFKTAPVHQAYIEPHACSARFEAGWPG